MDDPKRNFEIDLALAVMCCLVRRGERISHRVIAEVTGMSHGGPFMIEQRAMRKIRDKFKYTTHREAGEELVA